MVSRFLRQFYGECGVGLTYLGVQSGRQPDTRVATLWFAFLLLPVLPLKRFRFRLQGNEWIRAEQLKLDIRGVLVTYFWGSLAAPLAFLGPMALCVREVYQQLGGPPLLHIPVILIAIAWFSFGLWKALDYQNLAWSVD